MSDTPREGDHHERPASADTPHRRINPRSPRQAIAPEPAPPPPGRSRHVRHPLVVALNALIMVAVLVVLAAGVSLYIGNAEFESAGPHDEDRTVMIASGTGLRDIASRLEADGIISNQYVFIGGVRAYRNTARLRAGEYEIAAGASMRQVMESLVSGRALVHSVTLPEGLTSTQIINRLQDHEVLTGEIDEIPEEGTLLPETYTFTRGTTRAQIVDQMREAQRRALAEIWERRSPDIPIETPEELVTLASIVEKETGRGDERPLVAGVFVNRLQQGMRLQSDPTIIYGVVGGQGSLGRPIRRSEIDTHTPYNTYQIDGLPPGPIANPGRAALEAVANPEETDALYFVADGTGGHAFARTLDEHNRNVARWREIERQRGETAADEVPAEALEDEAQAGQ